MNMSFYTIHPQPILKSKTLIYFFAALLFFTISAFSNPALQQDLHNAVLSVMDQVYHEQFDQARDDARKLIRKYPNEPAGYFVMAFATDSWMAHHQSDKYENEFYRYCDQVIEKGEKKLLEPNASMWNKFFIGGADGYKGTFEARYERWITAFRFGWKGVAVLLEIEKSGAKIPDIQYGIGCYNYWRSAMMKSLWWMPGVEDKREEGIQQLKKARSSGVYTSVAASMELVTILINEQRFDEALTIADEGLKKYPESTIFTWGKSRSLAGVGEHDKAILFARKIIDKTERKKDDNHFNVIQYHMHIARTQIKQKKYVQALSTCNKIAGYKCDKTIKKRLEPTFKELKSLKKIAVRGVKKR